MNQRYLISSPCHLAVNLLLVYVIYELCRLAFLLENYSVFAPNLTWASAAEMLKGGWMFDTSAILYTNALYIVLMLLPLHLKEHHLWQCTAKWVFVVCNTIGVVANLCDAVYFQYTGRRTTVTVFQELDRKSVV